MGITEEKGIMNTPQIAFNTKVPKINNDAGTGLD